MTRREFLGAVALVIIGSITGFEDDDPHLRIGDNMNSTIWHGPGYYRTDEFDSANWYDTQDDLAESDNSEKAEYVGSPYVAFDLVSDGLAMYSHLATDVSDSAARMDESDLASILSGLYMAVENSEIDGSDAILAALEFATLCADDLRNSHLYSDSDSRVLAHLANVMHDYATERNARLD